jgi:hypothetical protein
MKARILLLTITSIFLITLSCNNGSNSVLNNKGRILRVPSDYHSIELAVKNSESGDWIILAPGKYNEMKIDINKPVTISSEWKLTGDTLNIDQTTIDSQDSMLFSIYADSTEISGLTIINGDHPLNINALVTVSHNHLVNNLDALSFEGSGGGYAGYNTIENDRDDGIDLDIRNGEENHGRNIVVEHNTITGSHDDGMEIRLYDYPDQNISYIIRHNRIFSSSNAGIQIISYDIYTGKKFTIDHNIIKGCKTGFGCMEGANTREDMTGASKMDELVLLFNNTLIGNQMGATGGIRIIALNNLVAGNSLGGFRRFGKNSAIINNLFYSNNNNDLVEINDSAKQSGNIFAVDPELDQVTFAPASDSRCIDAGLVSYKLNDGIVLEVPPEFISGKAPDIGAIELKEP